MNFTIDSSTGRKELQKTFLDNDCSFKTVCISKKLTREELIELVERNSGEEYSEALYLLIVRHSKATPKTHELILKNISGSSSAIIQTEIVRAQEMTSLSGNSLKSKLLKIVIITVGLIFLLVSFRPLYEHRDTDRDNIKNSVDADIDNDGIRNEDDPDENGDGINEKDPPLDTDGDNVKDEDDWDIDGDGLENDNDLDENGDGINDKSSPNEPPLDTDGDGVSNDVEEFNGTDPKDSTENGDTFFDNQ